MLQKNNKLSKKDKQFLASLVKWYKNSDQKKYKLSPRKRLKMGNPDAIKVDMDARTEQGEKVSDHDYGLYKKHDFGHGICAYGNPGVHGKPNIILEFPITTSEETFYKNKILPRVLKKFKGLESRTTMENKKIVAKTYRDDQKNYELDTDLGQFYFFRDTIIRDLNNRYRTQGINKTNSNLKIQKDLRKLTPKMFGYNPHPEKKTKEGKIIQRRKLLHLSTEAIRKVLSKKPLWDYPGDFPQHLGAKYPFIGYKVFKKLGILS
jgi:hypothetical protein